MTYDVFRPSREPARTLYDAFQSEALLRKERTVEEWTTAELQAVYRAAADCAPKYGLGAPTMDMTKAAEIYSRGSVDYGLKWVCTLLRMMQTAQLKETQ